MIRTIIVDDEEPARRLLRFRLDDEPDFEILGEAFDGQGAVDLIEKLRPEVAFLDIHMPALSGLDVVTELGEDAPVIIFVTAYDHFAVDAFERRALDYVLKPIQSERWAETVRRIRETLAHSELVERHRAMARLALGEVAQAHRSPPSGSEFTSPHDGFTAATREDRIVLLRFHEISRVEAARNYVRLVTDRGVFQKRITMAGLMDALPSDFVRIHRSSIVNLGFVEDIRREWHGDYLIMMRDGAEVRMSRRYAEGVLRR